jgi:GT2 family glycosyltransferase
MGILPAVGESAKSSYNRDVFCSEGAHLPTIISVVLSWNGREDTLACLQSLDDVRYAGGHQVLLVDNASTDDTVEAVRTRFPEVRVIVNPRNLGYAAGCNVGGRAALNAGADYVWLLNNDVTVEADALGEMVRLAEDDRRVGVVGPRVRTPTGVDELGAWWDFSRARVVPALGRDAPPDADRLYVDYVWGCAMLLSAPLLWEVGLFDERYVAYFEDADLCWRARARGYIVVAAPSARVRHAGSQAADRRPLWQTWRRAMSRLRFFWAHALPSQRPAVVAHTVLREWPLLVAGMLVHYHGGRKVGSG